MSVCLHQLFSEGLTPGFATLWACKLLHALGLGVVVTTASSEAGNRAGWFFVKRPVDDRGRLILAALGFTSTSTPSITTYTDVVMAGEALPMRAEAVDWVLFPCPSEASLHRPALRYLQNCSHDRP